MRYDLAAVLKGCAAILRAAFAAQDLAISSWQRGIATAEKFAGKRS